VGELTDAERSAFAAKAAWVERVTEHFVTQFADDAGRGDACYG
jgi:hypothetical protein